MRLGAYEILSPLGAGGMGEVYKARDTKLGRDVAIKILPEAFDTDPDRVARFEREAQLLAALNHPNIAAIYGLEESAATKFLVLELVEGESLAARLKDIPSHGSSRAIPVGEALAIARQLVDALEAAHDKGIIHRDLKPANVMLTPEGQVKVLDFGLAKLEAGGAGGQAGDAAHSPTLTHMATQAGMILGTAAYMSPEQAKGRVADKRSDVWAFGCVLYEMLAGKRAFDGEDATEMIAAVVRAEPDWNALPASLPTTVRSVVRRCLEKDRKTRIPDLSVVRFLLDERPSETPSAPAGVSGARRARRQALPWIITAVALAAAAAALWVGTRPSSDRPTPIRVSAETGTDVALEFALGPAVVLSPDGKTLIIVGRKPGQPTQLFMRSLDRLNATLIAGTDDARSPFFSPDGEWVAFFAAGQLKKISLAGGAAITLCDAPNARGGAWSEDDFIAFLPAPGSRVPLQRVSAAGGKPEQFIAIGDGEVSQRFPQFLPGGQAVLYTTSRTAASYDEGSIVVHQLASGEKKTVVQGGYFGRYLPSGHVVYMRGGTFFAVPFDVSRLETTGPPVPVLERVRGSEQMGFGHLAVSNTGTIAYLGGASDGTVAPILWLDGSDKTSPMGSTASDWSNIHFSPDGRRLVLDMNDGVKNDVFTYDWERDVLTRLTLDPSDSSVPVWSHDGQRIAFRSNRNGSPNLYWQRADGSGDVQRLTEGSEQHAAGSWHPSGKFLAYTEILGGVGPRLMILPMDGDEKSGWKPGKPYVFLEGAPAVSEPVFSPDGKWIAYVGNDRSRNQVFVHPFPGPGGRRQVTSVGGTHPTWSRRRGELFFESPDRQVHVVCVHDQWRCLPGRQATALVRGAPARTAARRRRRSGTGLRSSSRRRSLRRGRRSR